MLAAQLIEPGAPLRLVQVPVPAPERDEVLVRVAACGLCGTDLHLAVAGDIPVERTPITLGHEAAGVIAATGEAVADFQIGDRVVLFPAAFCGVCRFCLEGRESLCDRSKVYGMARDGALAEFISAPARAVMRLPPSVSFEVGAIMTDAVATPFHALRARGRLQAGETVGIVGCGGLGTHAVMLARMLGASRVVVIDVDERALARARDLGADLTINPHDGDPAKVVRTQYGRGVDLALEFVGSEQTVGTAIRILDKRGRAVVVGVSLDRPTLPPLATFVGREQSVIGSFGMNRADISDLLDMAASGAIDVSGSISARYPLRDCNTALQRLARKEEGVVRIVVTPPD